MSTSVTHQVSGSSPKSWPWGPRSGWTKSFPRRTAFVLPWFHVEPCRLCCATSESGDDAIRMPSWTLPVGLTRSVLRTQRCKLNSALRPMVLIEIIWILWMFRFGFCSVKLWSCLIRWIIVLSCLGGTMLWKPMALNTCGPGCWPGAQTPGAVGTWNQINWLPLLSWFAVKGCLLAMLCFVWPDSRMNQFVRKNDHIS